MKAKLLLYSVSIVLTMALLAGCSRLGTRSDAQIAGDVLAKINADSNVHNKQIGITSDHGVVTLTGTADNDLERTAAANDAGQVDGVKTVVNNIEVQSAANQPAPPMSDTMAPASQPVETTTSRSGTTSMRVHHSANRTKPTPDRYYSNTNSSAPSSDTTASSTNLASNSASSAAPVEPPKPVTVTIPEGTVLNVRLIDGLSSETNKTGETFRATLDTPLVGDDNKVAIPAGSEVEGRIVDAKPSTHFSGNSNLALDLTRVMVGGKSYDIATTQWEKKGGARGKGTAGTIAGGAALGALIGGLAGGGKGAAIGAGAGAGAGTAERGITHGEAIKLPPETTLQFRTTNAVMVTPATGSSRQRVQ